jgi:DNA-directed RNA polymerase specialized sigma24 family protein
MKMQAEKSSSAGGGATTSARRTIADVQALLGALDDVDRRIVVLHRFEGLDISQVASVVGCPLRAAVSTIRRSRTAMRGLRRRQPRSPVRA